jgi:hypothetical protein
MTAHCGLWPSSGGTAPVFRCCRHRGEYNRKIFRFTFIYFYLLVPVTLVGGHPNALFISYLASFLFYFFFALPHCLFKPKNRTPLPIEQEV